MITINKGVLINQVIGTIYEMGSFLNHIHTEEIVNALIDYFYELRVEDCIKHKKSQHWYCHFNDYYELYDALDNCLSKCDAFKILNICNVDYDKGVRKSDDGIVFTSIDTSIKSEYDFIDLTACLQNIVTGIETIVSNSEDCFLCKYGSYYFSGKPSDCDKCLHCKLNPNYIYNYEIHPLALIKQNKKEEWAKEHNFDLKTGKYIDNK